MCGIAGIVAWDEKYRVTCATLAAMSAKIGALRAGWEGFFLTRENEPITPDTPQVGFAFRRLAILDPDPRSMQPFTIGHQTMVFNGEIYNFRELKSELSRLRPDYQWRTTGDTEVLLMSYQVWGEKCVEHLNGMFAIAVWDEREKTLFLTRDRMGQKPLYAAPVDRRRGEKSQGHFVWSRDGLNNRAVAFASELGALTHIPWIESAVSDAFLGNYLIWGFASAPIYQGIAKVSPRTTVTVTSEWTLDRCYDSSGMSGDGTKVPDPVEDVIAVSRTKALVEEAVRKQLVSDVPIGCFLSGGIDSSVIAASMCAAATKENPPHTFSIGFEDPRYDESGWASQVAKFLGASHKAYTVHPNVAADLSEVAQTFGEPFGDSSALPTYYLSREVARDVKVCLSGDGGDELFGGYDRYRAMLWAQRIESVVRADWQERGALVGQAAGHPKSRMTRAKRFLESIKYPPASRYELLTLLDGRQLEEGFSSKYGHWSQRDIVAMRFRFAERNLHDVVRAAMATDRFIYLPLDLLTKVDRCSMRFGLEVRSPFMDHELVQFAAGLTTDQLLKGGPKRMLREAFKDDLPAWVFKRKKMGFAVPIGEWFRTDPPLKAMLHDNLFSSDSFGATHFNMNVVRRLVDEHMAERVDHSQRLYALLMLELWWRTQKS